MQVVGLGVLRAGSSGENLLFPGVWQRIVQRLFSGALDGKAPDKRPNAARPRGHAERCAARESSGHAADARDSERLLLQCGGWNVTGAKGALRGGFAALETTSAPRPIGS